MKVILLLVLVAALALVVGLMAKKVRRPGQPALAISPEHTLEEKLESLAQCGLRLDAPFTVDDLLASWDRSEYEKPGYETVLLGLAITE